MMNASRVFAAELSRKQTKENSRLLAECCEALSLLVDFVHDVTGLYPAWGERLLPFRSLMTFGWILTGLPCSKQYRKRPKLIESTLTALT